MRPHLFAFVLLVGCGSDSAGLLAAAVTTPDAGEPDAGNVTPPATGGAPSTGGVRSTGGAPATGGAVSTGGSETGGSPDDGGVSTGGTSAGGSVATGGAIATGGTVSSGGAGTGGAVSTQCGDKIKGSDEQCDDGNLVNTDGCGNDCQFTCSNANDCPGEDWACATFACVDHKCTLIPDPWANGKQCASTTNGPALCKGTACTTGTCGDGVMDPGELCDFGAANNTAENGCLPSCVPPCSNAGPAWVNPCDDADPCNGAEGCADLRRGSFYTHVCALGAPLAEGATCGTFKVCRSGRCVAR